MLYCIPGIAMILTARLWMASCLPTHISEATIHTFETYSILDLNMLLWIIARWFGLKKGDSFKEGKPISCIIGYIVY